MVVSEVNSATQLRELYPFIEEGVAAIIYKQSTPCDVIAPDVYHKILIGSVKLLVMHDDDVVWGWCTYCVNNDNTAVCQDMYIVPKAPSHLLYEFVDYLEKFVKAESASSLVFTSTRRAWGRKLAKAGYSLQCFVFGKDF